MNNGVILPVEDNPDDVRLTLRARPKFHSADPVVVAGDGVKTVVSRLVNEPPHPEARP